MTLQQYENGKLAKINKLLGYSNIFLSRIQIKQIIMFSCAEPKNIETNKNKINRKGIE